MEIKIETGGLRLDKALSDLTEFITQVFANEQIKIRPGLGQWSSQES